VTTVGFDPLSHALDETHVGLRIMPSVRSALMPRWR
jgi:hypothetical protein